MPACKKIPVPRRGICAGDLDRRIKIKARSLLPSTSGVKVGESFATVKTVWAAMKSTKGRQSWYSTNLDKAVTHAFYVRWYDGIESNFWVEYKSENYDIVEVDNLDERGEFAVLYCNVKGDADSPVNHA